MWNLIRLWQTLSRFLVRALPVPCAIKSARLWLTPKTESICLFPVDRGNSCPHTSTALCSLLRNIISLRHKSISFDNQLNFFPGKKYLKNSIPSTFSGCESELCSLYEVIMLCVPVLWIHACLYSPWMPGAC